MNSTGKRYGVREEYSKDQEAASGWTEHPTTPAAKPFQSCSKQGFSTLAGSEATERNNRVCEPSVWLARPNCGYLEFSLDKNEYKKSIHHVILSVPYFLSNVTFEKF